MVQLVKPAGPTCTGAPNQLTTLIAPPTGSLHIKAKQQQTETETDREREAFTCVIYNESKKG